MISRKVRPLQGSLVLNATGSCACVKVSNADLWKIDNLYKECFSGSSLNWRTFFRFDMCLPIWWEGQTVDEAQTSIGVQETGRGPLCSDNSFRRNEDSINGFRMKEKSASQYPGLSTIVLVTISCCKSALCLGGFSLAKGYSDDPHSAVYNLCPTVTTVCWCIIFYCLPKVDQALGHNSFTTVSSGGEWDATKVTVCLSLAPGCSVGSTPAVLVDLLPVLQ